MPIEFFKHAYGPVSANRPIPMTVWGHFDLFWVHAGRMMMHFEPSGECKMEAGQGVLIYPHTPFRSGEVEGHCRASVQHFRLKGGTDLPNLFRPMLRMCHGHELMTAAAPEAIDTMIASAIRLAELPQKAPVADMRLAQLTLLLGELKLGQQKAPAKCDNRLHALLDELDRHPLTNLTLADMAQRVGFSESHFRAVFKARQGESPAQYRQFLRMREAARLLRETDHTIKQIARQLGFTQLSHFYRRFHSAHRVTPARYRREHLNWA